MTTIPTQAQLHEEADAVFRDAHPDAPAQLDPNDPNHAPYVERWLDIRDQIRDDAAAKFDHDAGAASAPSTPVSLLNVESDPSDLGAILLNFDGAIDPASVGPWLWPNGVPADVKIEAVTQYTIRLRGLTNRAWMDMDPGVQEMIKDAGLVPMEA